MFDWLVKMFPIISLYIFLCFAGFQVYALEDKYITMDNNNSGFCGEECSFKVIEVCEQLELREPFVERVGQIVCFSGEVTDEVASSFIQADLKDGDIIVARSGGGLVYAGLHIAEEIIGKRITTVAWDYCNSSCAIYIFVPARWKYQHNSFSVGFHGLHRPEWIREEDTSVYDKAEGLWRFETTKTLYQRLGVNSAIYDIGYDNPKYTAETRTGYYEYRTVERYAEFGVVGFSGNKISNPKAVFNKIYAPKVPK